MGHTVGDVTDEQPAYGSTADTPQSLRRVRTRHFRRAKEQGIKITGLTSYDFLSATIFDAAGIDFLLVGDSAGNTVFGYDTTLPVTIEELIPLCRAVVRGAKRALVVADLPFGSYEAGPDDALHTAIRFMKETDAHAVKLEGGVRSAKQIKRIVRAGIPVMAHIGFTPQSEHGLGGHLIQGRGEGAARPARRRPRRRGRRRVRGGARDDAVERRRAGDRGAEHPDHQRRRRSALRRSAAGVDRLGRLHDRAASRSS